MIFLMESVTPSSRGAVSGDETGFKRHEPVPFSLDERVLAGNGREASDGDAMLERGDVQGIRSPGWRVVV